MSDALPPVQPNQAPPPTTPPKTTTPQFTMPPDTTEHSGSLINLKSRRAAKARFSRVLSQSSYNFIWIFAVSLALVGGLAIFAEMQHLPGFAFAAALFLAMFAVWWKGDLQYLMPSNRNLTDRLSSDLLRHLTENSLRSPRGLWQATMKDWQSVFILNRFLVTASAIETTLNETDDTAVVWQRAVALADSFGSQAIEVCHLDTALILESSSALGLFTHLKHDQKDILSVASWLTRSLEMLSQKKPDYGGIARDWTHGYTPTLDHFGYNVSLGIERSGGHYTWLSQSASVNAMRGAFSEGATALAVIGDPGIGKTSYVSALAQNLLQEKKDPRLEHRQVISLSASMIISSAGKQGQLEQLMNQLLGEAAHAGHIIIFLDDASLFFSEGTGSFDAVRILQPVLQSRAVQLIMALTPADYQRLKAVNTSFASLLTPIVLQEMGEDDVMRILEDTTLNLEHKHRVHIAYEALREAYTLSDRYEHEIAYPGKAINLLEQSLPYAVQKVVTAESVQRAIEQSRGVKVMQATAEESDTLLNLESKIHERMINQTRAVSVVAAALRRARAGIANPRRPIGSFLFFGPTGVGKTELAKAISGIYFGAEARMIRLDMSEYQQPDDVQRLLSSGTEDASSLIMSIRQQPFGVVLLDEIEKAHPNILNLLLQMLDEGNLTDTHGRKASFKDCIIIATSNAGADTIRDRVLAGDKLETFEKEFTDQLIAEKQFKPELLNRFDEIVLFRPLNQEELAQVVRLMLGEINQTLKPKNIVIDLTPEAIQRIVAAGYDPRLGARPMRRTLQSAVEDIIAEIILRGQAQPGDLITLEATDLKL